MAVREDYDVVASAAAFARAAYTDLLTVAVLSVLVTLSALPVVTFGAGLLALVETVTAVVTGENRGGPETERERLALFGASFRRNLRRGGPYGVLVLAVGGLATLYANLLVVRPSAGALLGAVVGLYAVVVVPVWVLRAGSVVARAADPPGFVGAMREAAYVALEAPAYSALHLVLAGLLVLVSGAFVAPVFVALPGLLAVLEVVAFEELVGMGAGGVVAGYRGEVS